ncbi:MULTISPECIES: carbohydrate ABC transporter permease [unclassified Meiothermus]|uniref:carbohydrate ABC transporter permease n=1 Tax=unclassified Meiothermus TaxID=370471 RepID=UPI000D7BD641|nr:MULTISPECIES: sugar ABC transporter permease [unclassified Meiothermus]PZA07862.1 sugar ABC transporter permease [Meiothermus sp. Pnk-1]RYM38833.1 sugar ABC transporter permease [Meiothermus sp. PNK-Is4]
MQITPRLRRNPRRAASFYQARWLVVFLGLPLLLYSVWVIYPFVRTFTLAFTNYDGLSPAQWVGWQNFREMFQTEAFRLALWHNLIWILIFITVPTSAGLGLAMVLNQGVRFDRFLKIAYYLPLVLAPVVTAMVWGWIYHPQQGLVNTVIAGFLGLLKAVGFDVNPEEARSIGWLGDPKLALISVIAAAVWRQVGYVMVLYLAGLKTLDAEVLEAARVDGAEGFSLFRHIIFPMLAPVTTVVVVISIVDSLRSFDLVNVMTDGGPFNSSEVLANYMVKTAFHDYRQGYAAAVAVILFLITFVFTLVYLRQVMAQEERNR